MSARRRNVEQVDLAQGADALTASVALSAQRMAGPARKGAEALSAKIAQRGLAGMGVTVVALAGATGSGKSSLFNRLAGRSLAQVSPLRPTTDRALAVSGNHPTRALVQWLDVGQWSIAPGEPPLGEESLVLVDLPDFDSIAAANREEAERLISKADLVVWVTDPQKYADGVLHLDFLSTLSEHAGEMVVALNQIDTLAEVDRPSVEADLARLLASEGLDLQVVPVSARTGEGLGQLESAVVQLSKERAAAARRLEADLRAQGNAYAEEIAREGGNLEPRRDLPPFDDTAAELVRYSSAGAVAMAAASSYFQRGLRATGWLPVRWVRGLRSDPLDRQHRGSGTVPGSVPSHRPNQADVMGAQVSIRRYVDAATGDLPAQWRHFATQDASSALDQWLDRVDRVDSEDRSVLARRPRWWTVMDALQWLAAVAAVVGLAWLAVLWIASALRIAIPEPPYWGIVPWPTWMLVAGVGLGLLAAALSRVFLRLGRHRTEVRVRKLLSTRVGRQAREDLLPALAEESARYADFTEAVRRLRSVGVEDQAAA